MSPQRYRPEAVIGDGAFSIVFRARDESRRGVALKMLRNEWRDDPRAAWRLRAEAAALCASASPHVLPVIALLDDVQPGIVTPLAAHGNLGDIIQNGPWPLDDVARVAEQLAQGLGTLHAMRRVHGDLHPGNILVHGSTHADRPLGAGVHLWLADPWVPTAVIADQPGWCERGAPYFAAPERATSDPTVAGDLYAATLVVLLLALGSPDASDEQALPAAWRDVALRGLATDPADRPGDAGTWLALALEAIERLDGSSRCAMT